MPQDSNTNKLNLSPRQREILDDLMDAWEESAAKGHQPDPAELCREFPELVSALKSQIDALKQTAWLDQSISPISAEREELSAGMEIVPGYELEQKLGVGGFGTVWRARGPGSVQVALKCLWMGEEKSRLEWKALAHLKELRHPHLLGIFGLWVSHGWFVVGSELADQTLAAFHKQGPGAQTQSFNISHLLNHLREAAEALDFLHKRNPPLVHGDVKPENLLLVGGHCKVGDFGLMRRVLEADFPRGDGVTLAYAAPESLLGKAVPASDQYALAVTYCHLRGCEPFRQKGLELAQAHLEGKPDLSALTTQEARVIFRALSKLPEKRFSSCIEMVRALENAKPRWGDRLEGILPRKLAGIAGCALLVGLLAGLAVTSFFTIPSGFNQVGLGPVLVYPTPMVGMGRPNRTGTVCLRSEGPERLLAIEDGGTVCGWQVSKRSWEDRPVATHDLWACMDVVRGEKRAVAGQGVEPFLVQEWDTQTGQVVREYPGHKGLVRGVSISDDGALVASVSHQGAIQVNRRADGASVFRFVQDKKEFNAVRFTREGDGFVAVSGDGRVLFHRFGEKGVRTIHLQKGIQFWGLARLPVGGRFLAGGTDGRLLEIDIANPGRVRVVVEIEQSITDLVVDESSGLVLIGTGKIQSLGAAGDWAEPADYPLILVDPVKGKILGRFPGHKDLIRSLVWTEDGQQVFSTSLDGQDLRWTVLGLARQGP